MRLSSSVAPGSSNTLQNSQVRVLCQQTVVTHPDANTTRIRWALQFKTNPAWMGKKRVNLKAVDQAGLGTGFKFQGNWTVNP